MAERGTGRPVPYNLYKNEIAAHLPPLAESFAITGKGTVAVIDNEIDIFNWVRLFIIGGLKTERAYIKEKGRFTNRPYKNK